MSLLPSVPDVPVVRVIPTHLNDSGMLTRVEFTPQSEVNHCVMMISCVNTFNLTLNNSLNACIGLVQCIILHRSSMVISLALFLTTFLRSYRLMVYSIVNVFQLDLVKVLSTTLWMSHLNFVFLQPT